VLVDTHCHLADEKFASDWLDVMRRARAAGVTHAIIVADSAKTTVEARSLATQLGISATAGVHPHVASTWSTELLSATRDAVHDTSVVAVGETGLDYHYEFSPRDVQRKAFADQLALGAEVNRPVVVHARDADDDIAAMIRDAEGTIVLHSFSSGPTVFEAGLSVGAYFSFSGMVTFKNWDGNEYVRQCPPDRLLLETDAPYLAPVPHRGKRNEPSFVTAVAEKVAAIRGMTVENISTLTTNNAAQCFGARVAQPFESV
jgi:TatD DNase family protein